MEKVKRQQYRQTGFKIAGWKKGKMTGKQTGFHKFIQTPTYYQDNIKYILIFNQGL